MYVLRRGSSRHAAHLVRGIIANHDQRAVTAHNVAADTAEREQLPERVQGLLERRERAVQTRRMAYWQRQQQICDQALERQQLIDHHLHRSQSREQSLDCGIEL